MPQLINRDNKTSVWQPGVVTTWRQPHKADLILWQLSLRCTQLFSNWVGKQDISLSWDSQWIWDYWTKPKEMREVSSFDLRLTFFSCRTKWLLVKTLETKLGKLARSADVSQQLADGIKINHRWQRQNSSEVWWGQICSIFWCYLSSCDLHHNFWCYLWSLKLQWEGLQELCNDIQWLFLYFIMYLHCLCWT